MNFILFVYFPIDTNIIFNFSVILDKGYSETICKNIILKL